MKNIYIGNTMIKFIPRNFLCAWIDLFSAIVSVLTLGMYWPTWEMNIRVYFLKKDVKHKKYNCTTCSEKNKNICYACR